MSEVQILSPRLRKASHGYQLRHVHDASGADRCPFHTAGSRKLLSTGTAKGARRDVPALRQGGHRRRSTGSTIRRTARGTRAALSLRCVRSKRSRLLPAVCSGARDRERLCTTERSTTAGALSPMYTVFMRVVGAGSCQPLDKPLTLKLCFDNDRQALVTVRALEGERPSSRHWRGRFSDGRGARGRRRGNRRASAVGASDSRLSPTASPAPRRPPSPEPMRSFELLDDQSERMREVASQPESESVIAALRVVENEQSRFVILAPALWVMTPKSAQARTTGHE